MDVLKSEIEKGKLPFPVGQTTLTPKKKYGAKSGNDIDVDVEIEVFRDPTKKPFLIALVDRLIQCELVICIIRWDL